MNVEIYETENGWIVQPSSRGRDYAAIETASIHVFNRFEDMVEYLRSQSKIAKQKPDPFLIPADPKPTL